MWFLCRSNQEWIHSSFLPHDSMHSAVYAVAQSSSSRMRVIYHNWSATKQRPHPQSVAQCLSVTFVYCVETSKQILKTSFTICYLHSSSFSIDVTKRCGNIPTGPPNGCRECRWPGIQLHFWLISQFISEMVQDKAIDTGTRTVCDISNGAFFYLDLNLWFLT